MALLFGTWTEAAKRWHGGPMILAAMSRIFRWLREHAFRRPSAQMPSLQHPITHSESIGPIWKAHRLTVPSYANGVTSVADLSRPRGPTAVAGSVRAIVVDPVEFQSVRAFTHVSKEGTEARFPFMAHRYTALAVVLVISSVFTTASRLCPGPRFIGSAPIGSYSAMTVGSLECARYFTLAATATACLTQQKVACVRSGEYAAITTANPDSSLPRGLRDPFAAYDEEPLKSLAVERRHSSPNELNYITDINVVSRGTI